MIHWPDVRTVLLDMDGTLLDLHFDHLLWHEHLPRRYAELHGVERSVAEGVLRPRLAAAEGTLSWYCLLHWTREFGIDVSALEHELAEHIAVRPGVEAFLARARAAGKQLILATNAHPLSLGLKLARTGLARHFDAVVSAHDLGHPKEEREFWVRLDALHPFEPNRSVFVDDSARVRRSASAWGIRHVLAVARPNSRAPRLDTGAEPTVDDFRELADGLP